MPGAVNCGRGYEWWLMRQAVARDPGIRLYGLMWGAPGRQRGGWWFGADGRTTGTWNRDIGAKTALWPATAARYLHLTATGAPSDTAAASGVDAILAGGVTPLRR